MTVLELRAEIHKAVDQLPESVLPELLQYINELIRPTAEKEGIEQFAKKIKTERL